jgi:hypothetical protein
VRRRLWLVVPGFALLILGLPFAAATLGIVARDWPPPDVGRILGYAMLLLLTWTPPALGLGLVRLGAPGIAARLLRGVGDAAEGARRRVAGALTASARPGAVRSRLGRILRTSVGLGLVTAAVSLVLMYALQPAAAWIAFAAVTLYALTDAALNTWRRSWWLGAVMSVAVWLPVFGVLTEAADALNHLRESMMVFLLPFMLYPAALALSGLVRLGLRWSRQAPGPPPA